MSADATIEVRDADASEVDALAALWYAAYRDGHDGLLPEPPLRARPRGTVGTRRVGGAVLHLAYCGVFELRGGRIARPTSYLMPLPS